MARIYSLYKCDGCGTEIKSDNPVIKDWHSIGTSQLVYIHNDEYDENAYLDFEFCGVCIAKVTALIIETINGVDES